MEKRTLNSMFDDKSPIGFIGLGFVGGSLVNKAWL